MLNAYNSATIYISQNDGSDEYSGYAPKADGYGAGPLKSVDKLIDVISSMRVAGVLQPISVKFMGDYYLTDSLKLGVHTANGIYGKNFPFNNIVFESYGDKRARIIGGRRLEGFKKDRFNGVDCISLEIPDVKSGVWHFTDLFVNGKPAKPARYPKEGTLEAVATETSDQPDAEKYYYKNGSKWFIAKKEDLEGIDGIENAIVSYYHYWIDEHSPVESYDRETGKLVMKSRSRMNLTIDYENSIASDLFYYLENIPQTLSSPNEWYLDVENGKVYYIPEEGMDIDNLEIFAPTVRHIAEINGTPENKAVGIRFRNIDFACTRGDYASTVVNDGDLNDHSEEGWAADIQSAYATPGAFRFENAEACAIENCNITCTGLHAVDITRGCNAIRVENCVMTELGAGGVKIFGALASEGDDRPTGGCIIRGNTIKGVGRRYASACGVLICHSANNEVSENEICYLDYSGVSVGWVWGYAPSSSYANIIRRNHIHHVGMGRLSDMGAIYLLGLQNGTIVEGNLIHDVNSNHYGGWGIYTDEGSSYITIENNIVFNCKSNCFVQHFGSFNTLKNNIFAFGGESVVKFGRRQDHTSVIFENNTFITDGKPIYQLGDNTFVPCVTSSRNKVWDISGKEPDMYIVKDTKKAIGLEEWKSVYGFDEESVIEKPDCLDENGKLKI